MEKIKAGRQTIDFLQLCYRSDRPPMLWGHHGIGKTELLEQAAAVLGIKFVSRDLSLLEPPDLVGMPVITGKTTRFLPPEFLPRSGKGILVFEELNRCDRFVRAPCLQLLTSRTLNDYRLPNGWLPAAAANPTNGDYEVFDLDAALLSRFVQVTLVPDQKEWLDWAHRNEIHPAVLEYVGNDSSVFDNPQSNPRAWKYVSDIVRATEKEDESDKSLRAAVLGLVGNKRGAAFLRTLKGSEPPLKPDTVISAYTQHRPKVRRWVKDGKLDLVAATLLALKKYLQPKAQYELVKKDRKLWGNLTRFFYDLPGDFRDDAKQFFDERQYTFPRCPKK